MPFSSPRGYDPNLCDKQMRRLTSEAVGEWVFDDGRGKRTALGASASAELADIASPSD
jgi:hypothetical protein